MKHFTRIAVAAAMALAVAAPAHATLVEITNCGSSAVACTITTTPPNPVARDPNDGVLLAWNEVQNFTLLSDLRVDRVFDPLASFVMAAPGGDFFIKAGTVVSSHYIQWDPTPNGRRVTATITLDSQVFAFMTADQNMFNSDAALGLPGLDYNDFTARGLEGTDLTVFNGNSVNIDWQATSPGDWTRLITAFSPTAAIPVPASLPLMAGALGLAGLLRLRRKV
jgi:hypothetical protein